MRGFVFAVLMAAGSVATAADLHVPAAFPSIQAAVDAASDGDRILIAPGTYAERIDSTNTSFELIGADGPDTTILDARGAPGQGPALDLRGIGVHLIKGLTIRGDQGRDPAFNPYGAGIYKLGGSMTIDDCVIEECTFSDVILPGTERGTGAYFDSVDTLIITDTVFRNNTHPRGTGGGLYASAGTIELIGCRFENNTASIGGAAWITGIDLIRDCVFIGNHANDIGGALRCDVTLLQDSVFDSNTSGAEGGAIAGGLDQALNCVFSNNTARDRGGAIFNTSSAEPVRIDSSLFFNNSAASGSGIDSLNAIEVYNSILWNNGPSKLAAPGPIDVRWCIVEGGYPGDGNFHADPMFVDPIGGDFNLMTGSPAIDAGNNGLLLRDLEDLNNNGIISDGYPFDMVGNPRHTQDLFVPDTGVPDQLSFPLDLGPLERVIDAPTDGTADCNANFINDLVDIVNGTSADCNDNLIPDSCEISADPGLDANGDGVLDACEDPCLADVALPEGVLNIDDVLVFLNAFASGCGTP